MEFHGYIIAHRRSVENGKNPQIEEKFPYPQKK
jgi:hypothetical protein